MSTPARLVEAQRLWVEQCRTRREERFDEFLYLIQSGDSAEQAARRLGTNARSLQRQAYRWKRKDIVAYLSSATYRQRRNR